MKVYFVKRTPAPPARHNRRADDISCAEVKAFWNAFCDRKGIGHALRSRGEAEIERDPERWADAPAPALLAAIAG